MVSCTPTFLDWAAAYNFANGVPVEDGDERIIMIEVPTLYDEDKFDWKLTMQPASWPSVPTFSAR